MSDPLRIGKPGDVKDLLKNLDAFKPELLPPVRPFPDPDLILRYEQGHAEMPDDKKVEFQAWLNGHKLKREVLGKNESRLRSLVTYYVRLARSCQRVNEDGEVEVIDAGQQADMDRIGAFLLKEWGMRNFPLGDEPDDWAKRTKLILDCAKKRG